MDLVYFRSGGCALVLSDIWNVPWLCKCILMVSLCSCHSWFMGAFSTLRKRICISISITCFSPHSTPALEGSLNSGSPSWPTLPWHQGGCRNRGATGSALWEQGSCCRGLWWDVPLLMPSKDPWHICSCLSALPPCPDVGEGHSPVSCLVPNTGPCLHIHSEKEQPTKEQVQLGTLTPLPSPLLQGWQEDKQEALGTHPFLVSCRVVPVSKAGLEEDSYPKPPESISYVLDRDPKATVPSRLHLHPSCKPGGCSKVLCQPRHCSLSPALPLLICAVWMGCHSSLSVLQTLRACTRGGLGASNVWETTWAALQAPPATSQLNWGLERCSSCLPRKH